VSSVARMRVPPGPRRWSTRLSVSAPWTSTPSTCRRPPASAKGAASATSRSRSARSCAVRPDSPWITESRSSSHVSHLESETAPRASTGSRRAWTIRDTRVRSCSRGSPPPGSTRPPRPESGREDPRPPSIGRPVSSMTTWVRSRAPWASPASWRSPRPRSTETVRVTVSPGVRLPLRATSDAAVPREPSDWTTHRLPSASVATSLRATTCSETTDCSATTSASPRLRSVGGTILTATFAAAPGSAARSARPRCTSQDLPLPTRRMSR
jgi:hypothetical protein